MKKFNLNRRDFIKGTAATLALGSISANAIQPKAHYNVALIGTGWYGTSDLLRLIQVANVEVVALCDVDTEQVEKAAIRVADRQKSGKLTAITRKC
jgi:ornithine cyclodeaminase/alanine dehydrogenase-like protein (mu-crystallin family)